MRWLLNPGQLDAFLYTVTNVEIVPVEAELATNCQS